MTRINPAMVQPAFGFQQRISGDDKINAFRSRLTEAELGRDDGFECKRRYGLPITAEELAPVNVVSESRPGISPIDHAVSMIKALMKPFAFMNSLGGKGKITVGKHLASVQSGQGRPPPGREGLSLQRRPAGRPGTVD